MTVLRTLALSAALISLAACSWVPGVYRIDIQQGNVITQEQLAALERGMERRKVRFILGTPLVADAFNQDRWDYYYSLDRRGEERVKRVISVFFEDDRLVRVGGDVQPASGPIKVETRKDELVPVPDGYREEGFLAALTPSFLSDEPKAVEPATGEPASQDTASAPQAGAGETQPAPVTVTPEDERYLRELMAGFGKEPVPGAPPAAVTSSEARPGQTDDEGFLSDWARRLRLDEPPPPPSKPSP
jgi:outer membrane protein assembly factor BamE